MRESVFRDQEPERFKELVERDRDRRLRSLEDSKNALKETGVPECFWRYLDANCEKHSAGNMLGAIFDEEKDVIRSIKDSVDAQVFHIIPKYGNHVSVTVDVRDKETILFYIGDSLDEEEYETYLSETVEKIKDNV
jgi:hypothetical protein